MLTLECISLSRGSETLLRLSRLQAPSVGVVFLVGTGGTGKSSLLQGLARQCADTIELTGRAELDEGSILAGDVSAIYVPQHLQIDGDNELHSAVESLGITEDQLREEWIRLSQGSAPSPEFPLQSRSEKRTAALLARLMPAARLYLVDEPTANLSSDHAQLVRAKLAELAKVACVVMATHNRQDCLALGGHVALLAGGTLQEFREAADFFAHPQTSAGVTYVETGNCNLPHSRQSAPSNGTWCLVPGLLCGMSRPGLMQPAEDQYHALHDQGIRHLVCLEERREYPMEPVREHGLTHRHFSIADMAAPSFGQAVDICRELEPHIRAHRYRAGHHAHLVWRQCGGSHCQGAPSPARSHSEHGPDSFS
jgi:atypical dual specificity phosphatase